MKGALSAVVPIAPQGAASARAAQPVVTPQHCLECPATRNHLFSGLIGESSACCRFESLAVEARETIPLRWFGRFSFGVVRRGMLIRQRADAHGRVTAIDVVGPGGAFPIEPRPLDDAQSSTSAGYAVTRALVCACTKDSIDTALHAGGQDSIDLHAVQNEALYRMERIADARSRATVASRIAALVCTLADTLVRHDPARNRVPAGFMLRDFATLVSVRHESVCRVFRDFTKHDLVKQDDEGLHILDRKGLEAL